MNNHQCFVRAQQVIPGGVNSPVRAFKAVGGNPIFIEKAEGAYLYDVEGKRYIDYIGSWGPMILGHGHPDVIAALVQQAQKGVSYGASTPLETELAELIISLMPNIEKIRFVNSGTEASMSAIRLARGYTGKHTIIKFEGCYHGHSDSLLVKAGSGALTLGVPSSPGVSPETSRYTLTLDFNDSEQVETIFAQQGNDIAAVILEPIAGNMNLVKPKPEFLKTLRRVCDQYGAVLIVDEVMTGFRVALGGAQSLYDIKPDLTCLGKVIGGGLPVGAFGGKREIMDKLAPQGPVYQAGTLSGNPLAMTAGIATLKAIAQPGFYDELSAKATELMQGLQRAAKQYQVPFAVDSVGGMFGLYFTAETRIESFKQVMACNIERFKQFFQHMLNNGVYLAPSAFEAGFVSIAHSDADIAETIAAASRFFAKQ